MTSVATEVEILGVTFSAQRFDEAIERLLAAAKGEARFRAHFVNVHTLIEAHGDPTLRAVFARSDMICMDGMPIAWLARRRGAPGAERVSGPDVMLAVCDRGRRAGLRHYFYGGQPGVAAELSIRLKARFPGLEVVGAHAPPFRASRDLEDQAVIDAINGSKPDVLWIGLGAPKQEFWAADHEGRLEARLRMPVGAAFDFHSGRMRRAPNWLRGVGFEWLFRLAMDPRRLFRRYLVTNTRFLWLVGRDAIRRRFRGLGE